MYNGNFTFGGVAEKRSKYAPARLFIYTYLVTIAVLFTPFALVALIVGSFSLAGALAIVVVLAGVTAGLIKLIFGTAL